MESLLNGQGFILRSWRNSDAKDLSKNANSKNIWKNMHDEFPFPYTLEEAKKYLKERVKGLKLKTSLAIVVRGEVVGGIGFRPEKDEYRKTADVGYWISEKMWGKGIMTKALKLITKYAFKEFNLCRLEAYVFPWNKSSQRVLEKAGYKREAILKKREIKNKKIYDQILYSKVK